MSKEVLGRVPRTHSEGTQFHLRGGGDEDSVHGHDVARLAPGPGHSLIDCLLIVYRYTRTHLPHPPSYTLALPPAGARRLPVGSGRYCHDVIHRLSNTGFLIETASYDVASKICQALGALRYQYAFRSLTS
jgi:hypothetical protein